MNFTEFMSTEDPVDIELSEAGRNLIKAIIEEQARFPFNGDENQMNLMAYNDAGFDDEGFMRMELAASDTKSGLPYVYQLDFEEHYIASVTAELPTPA